MRKPVNVATTDRVLLTTASSNPNGRTSLLFQYFGVGPGSIQVYHLLQSEAMMDDEVEITDVDDGHFPPPEKGPVKNQDLGYFTVFAGELLSEYGWYLLAVTVLLYFLILHLSKKRPGQTSNRTSEAQDADFVANRQEAMEAARRRMQEELDAKALLFKEKQQQQEEERRKQKIESWESMQLGKSYKAKQHAEDSSTSVESLKPKSDKKPLRSSDYNPLAGGGGGSCSWRPGRRGPSSGG